MKKLFKTIPALLGALMLFQSACAMSFVQPYGYSVPLDLLAAEDKSATTESYAQYRHSQQYDGSELVWTGDANGMTSVYVGGLGYNGENLTQPLNRGKQSTTATFELSKGKYFGDSEHGYTLENMDLYGFYFTEGDSTQRPFGYKVYYAVAADDFCYAQTRTSGDSQTGIRLDYGVKYTVKLETDVPAKTIHMSITDESGRVISDITDNIPNLASCRNGFQFRLSNTFDARISELSTVRESFVVKNRTISKDDGGITASAEVAPNAVARSAYGSFPTSTPSLLLGEFDSENRMTAFAGDSKSVSPPSNFEAEPNYVTLSATLPVSRSGAYANACLWSDMDSMLSYGDMLTENIK